MYLYDENVITIKPRRVHLFVRSLSLPFQFLNDQIHSNVQAAGAFVGR